MQPVVIQKINVVGRVVLLVLLQRRHLPPPVTDLLFFSGSHSSGCSMEPRPYQAEAFDAARKANVVMVGATGVGKVRIENIHLRWLMTAAAVSCVLPTYGEHA